MILLLLAVFAFAPETQSTWREFCRSLEQNPPRAAEVIPLDQLRSIQELQAFNIAPPEDTVITTSWALDSCENFVKYQRGT